MLKKILIYNSGGGLGDAIQLFPLILSLKNHFKSGHFYYLGAHENHFLNKLKDFNVNIKTHNSHKHAYDSPKANIVHKQNKHN